MYSYLGGDDEHTGLARKWYGGIILGCSSAFSLRRRTGRAIDLSPLLRKISVGPPLMSVLIPIRKCHVCF